ncbi:MAG: helix-turn-helix transcriptional regulator [Paludibacteraceae bacterium]|nr:helix-turn-helix transcriptional regulator [Paludibacteraceae bacterium]
MNERQRLEQIIESEGLTAKQFAEEVGIQAGTISNIVNGRNNPSLDVMQRVLNRFRTISSDWLILGVGSMYRTNGAPDTTLFDIKPIEVEQSEHQEIKAENKSEQIISAPAQSKVIDKIMIFYTDGTFEER